MRPAGAGAGSCSTSASLSKQSSLPEASNRATPCRLPNASVVKLSSQGSGVMVSRAWITR